MMFSRSVQSMSADRVTTGDRPRIRGFCRSGITSGTFPFGMKTMPAAVLPLPGHHRAYLWQRGDGHRRRARPLLHSYQPGARRQDSKGMGCGQRNSASGQAAPVLPMNLPGSSAKLPPLTSRYTRIALTQKLRRVIDEGVGCGLALEGISAADVARSMGTKS
jgi:hypothetical protein